MHRLAPRSIVVRDRPFHRLAVETFAKHPRTVQFLVRAHDENRGGVSLHVARTEFYI